MRGGWFIQAESGATPEQLDDLGKQFDDPAQIHLPGRAARMMAKVTRSYNVKHKSGLTVRNADINRAKPFQWAWEQRIVLSYVNLLVGQEGIGKGNLVAWILARITRGELDGQLKGKPRNVLIAGDEDSYDHVWVPRLKVAGADLDRVKQLVAGKSGEVFDVRTDAEGLRQYIKEESLAVLYIDQLLDNLGAADNWKDKDVRNALAPIRAVAADRKVAILAALHPNKRKGGSFRDQLAGTPAFNALARSSLLVARHPHDADRVAVVHGKANYAKERPGFEFRIEGQQFVVKGHTIDTSRITDTKENSLTDDDVLGVPSKGRDDSKAGIARNLLEHIFADGEWHSAGQVQLDLNKHYSLSSRVVTEAATKIGLEKKKEGFQGEWLWRRTPAAGGTGDAG
jgi:hypothetical protein